MPVLTDRQRIELATPAYLLYALASAPGAFRAANPDLAAKAEADVAALREDLRAACLEPFADLVPAKRQSIVRRLERITQRVTADWWEQPALNLMLMLWYFLNDLTDREVLILWEGSAMDRATRLLLPMCEYGFEEHDHAAAAQLKACELLARLQAEGLYG